MTGNGMDRHLFVLAQRAKADGLSPALFETAAYQKLARIIISTSTLSSHALANGGFGPFHPDCFAIGYAIRSDVSGAQACGVAPLRPKHITQHAPAAPCVLPTSYQPRACLAVVGCRAVRALRYRYCLRHWQPTRRRLPHPLQVMTYNGEADDFVLCIGESMKEMREAMELPQA
jgi:hypothetical protein